MQALLLKSRAVMVEEDLRQNAREFDSGCTVESFRATVQRWSKPSSAENKLTPVMPGISHRIPV